MLSWSMYSSTASTAQHSTGQSHHSTKQHAKYAPIKARQRKQADRVSESQHVVLCPAVLCFLCRTHQKKYVRTCMRRPGCFPGAWSSWHLHVTCFHLKCWTIYHICHSVPFFLVSERSGQNLPLREAHCVIYVSKKGVL